MDFGALIWIIGAVVVILVVIPVIVTSFLRNVDAGSIRMVSWVQGGTNIYRGPGKSLEVPLLTLATSYGQKGMFNAATLKPCDVQESLPSRAERKPNVRSAGNNVPKLGASIR